MTTNSVSRRADIALSGLVVALGVGVVLEGRRLPSSQFDPLGPGGVPIGVGILLCVLGAWIGISTLLGRTVGGGQRMFSGLSDDTEDDGQPLRWFRSLAVYIMSIVYLLVLPLRGVGFFPATAVFMIVLLILLGERSKKSLIFSIPLSVGFVYAIDQIFRHVLLVNLP